MDDIKAAIVELKRHRKSLTWQEMTSIKGQILSGDVQAAMKGLSKILKRKRV